nr:protein kinase-like domain, concanavalin A-like lectin/glucanase domain protein [Tanacetum cinerariifolium]
MNNLESDDESVDTPLVSPFPHLDNDLDDGKVLNRLSEYENAKVLCQERIINSFNGDDLASQCMIGFRKFTAYLDPFLPMNIISRNAYNTIIVEGLEGARKNLVSIVRDVYVFVRIFTYITDFVVLEDIEEFIMSDMAEVVMGKPFRKINKLKYDVAKGLVSFTNITRRILGSLTSSINSQCIFCIELQAADRRRQTVISELLKIEHRRSTETSEARTTLQG